MNKVRFYRSEKGKKIKGDVGWEKKEGPEIK